MVVIFCSFAFCWLLVRRSLAERSPLLAVSLTYSLASLLLLALANTSTDRPAVALTLLLFGGALWWRQTPPSMTWPEFSRVGWAVLVVACGAVFVYTCLCQNLFLDDDFWIHYPLQGLLESNGLPVLHPFFSEIKMNGHYGRDLLVATAARLLETSLFHSQFWQTVLIQLSCFLTIVGLVYRSSRCELSAVLTPLFIFFGINVGGRGGMLDCFQNNNALAYLITVSLLHLFYLVYEAPSLSRVLTSGLALGTFALVYETHFGLLGLTLLAALLVTRRKEFAVIGALALVLAAVQGGPITGLVKQRLQPSQRVWTPGELNQHQIIKVTFPKKEIFEIQLAHGNYQRRSLVYDLLPDLGALSTISPGTPYRPIWSWDVLMIHWLATVLAPCSLFIIARKRPADPVGLGFWLFGATAYLTPALVHFGPIYEFEYFRWQFAAGFGFAGALGIAAGSFLENKSIPAKTLGVSFLVLLNIVPCLSVFFPRLVSTAVAKGTFHDAYWPRSEPDFVLSNKKDLGEFDYFDLLVAYELKSQRKPGHRLLVNAPWAVPEDIHYESTLTAISGVRSVGHSLPWPQEPVGTPPFHRSAPNRVFWVCPSLELLGQLDADWIFLRPGPEPVTSLRAWLNKHCQPHWQNGDYRLFYHNKRGGLAPLAGVSSQPSTLDPPKILGPMGTTWRTSELFTFGLQEDGRLWAWAFVKRGQSLESVDLHEVVTWRSGPCAGVTPSVSGDFDLHFFEVKDGVLHPTAQRIACQVIERQERLVRGAIQR